MNVLIDRERLLDLSQEWRAANPCGPNSRSPFATLAMVSSLKVSQLEGREAVARWKVESMAVLIKCLPQGLIKTTVPAKKPKTRKEPDMPAKGTKATPAQRVRKTCSCGFTTDWAPGFAAHLRKSGHSEVKEGIDAIEPQDFNADEPVVERECVDCTPAPSKTLTVTVDATFKSLQHELTDVRLRLIGAMVAGSDMALSTQAAIQIELDRVRAAM